MKPIVIKLIPTLFQLDVWISTNRKKLAKAFHKRYGASEKYYLNDIHINSVETIDSTEKSEMKGYRLFVMILGNRNKSTMIHEIIHVLWHMHRTIHLEMKLNSQEWQACMAEYIYNQITKTK